MVTDVRGESPCSCPQCGETPGATARFCPNCGTPLGPRTGDSALSGSTESERRQLTIVFSDLVGSTALSQRLDPEDLSFLIRDYQRQVEEIVGRYEGHVAQYLGDGVLIYFGFPQAHEDDVERAVRTGLDIVQAMKAVDREWHGRLGEPLQVRVGIHTGQVLIERIGGTGRSEQLALGETPNVAARLLAAAAPEQVVISARTQALVRMRFVVEDLGEHELKGIAEPMRISRVVRVLDATSRFDAAARAELTPLMGRAQELSLLVDRWRLAQEGDGQVVVIGAEPGLGKSRLLRELRRLLGQAVRTLFRFECSPFLINSAYQPLVDLFERLLAVPAEADPAEKRGALERLVGKHACSERDVDLLASLLGLPVNNPPTTGRGSPMYQKNEILSAAVDLTCALAREGRALMLFEDAHWADPSTLEFLDLLITRVPKTSLLVAITHRPEFIPPWTRRRQVTALTLSNLSRSQATAIIKGVAHGKLLPKRLIEEIVAKAGGVPLFIEEVTRAVLESDQLRLEDGKYVLAADTARLEVPVSLRASLMARLDRDPTAKQVAQVGAVIGREFERGLLGRVAPLPSQVLARGLDSLVASGLVFRDDNDDAAIYTFKHALVEAVAYESIPRSRRQALHKSTAAALDSPGGRPAPQQLLAHHYTEGGELELAIPNWHRAGQNALEVHANLEAIDHLSRGIELLDSLPASAERTQQMLEMQIALGAPLIATRGYAAAPVRACFNRARELSELVGKTQERSHIHRGLAAFYLIRADLAVARRLAEDSLVQAELDDDEGQLLEAHSWLGTILFYMAEISLARLQFDAALRIYDERRHHLHATRYGLDPAILCLVHLIWTRWLDGETEAAVETELETLALASRLGHPLSLAHALNFSAVHRQFRAEAAETQRFVVQEIALSQEHHLPHYAAYATILSGWVCAARGDPSRGVRLIMQGLDARRETGAELAKPFFLTLLAQAQHADGNVKAALDALAEAEEVMGRTAERWWEPEVHRLRGELLTAAATSAADLRDAEGSLRRALETARRHGCPALEARANGSLSRLLLGS